MSSPSPARQSSGFRAPEKPSAADECVATFISAARSGQRTAQRMAQTATSLRLEALCAATASSRRQSEQNLRAIAAKKP